MFQVLSAPKSLFHLTAQSHHTVHSKNVLGPNSKSLNKSERPEDIQVLINNSVHWHKPSIYHIIKIAILEMKATLMKRELK